MSTFNAQIFLNTFTDKCASNAPDLQNVRWVRNISGIVANNPQNQTISLAPGESRSIISGQRVLSQDNTTEYSISLKPFTSNTYTLSWTGGANPAFRTSRATAIDSTTKMIVTKNGPLLTLASVSSTAATFNGKVAGMATNIVLTASSGGSVGNSISLPFDGSTSISSAIITWNSANPSNMVVLTTGDGTQIPDNSTSIALSGGITLAQLDTTSVSIGDIARVGYLFNTQNRGTFSVISKTSNSITVENQLGVAEGPIVLGSDFAVQLSIYSSTGVQINDTLQITSGFSSFTRQAYKITDVASNYIEFYSTEILPEESNIITEIAIYEFAKKFLYLEADNQCQLSINDTQSISLTPIVVNNVINPALFLTSSIVFSLTIQNLSLDSSAKIFLISIE